MSRVQRLVGFSLCLLLSDAIGCSEGQDLGTIEGTVTYDGKPVDHGTILFEVAGARTAYGEIKEGRILNVTTSIPGDGVPIGEAKVAVNSLEMSTPTLPPEAGNTAGVPDGPSGMPTGRDLLPVKYANPATSGLTATIQKGKNKVELNLTSKP